MTETISDCFHHGNHQPLGNYVVPPPTDPVRLTDPTYGLAAPLTRGNGTTSRPTRKVIEPRSPDAAEIPPESDLEFARHGRICALTGSESAEAEGMRQHQQQQAGGTVRHDTYFTDPPSRIVSNQVRLPV